MKALGWPVSHLPVPQRSVISIDAVKVGSSADPYFAIRVPGTNEYASICKGIPEHRTYSNTGRCWLCKITPNNVKYLRRFLGQAQLTPLAERLAEKYGPQEVDEPKLIIDTERAISEYRFKTKFYDHQAKAFALSRDAESFALLMEQRTGKTKVIIDTAAWLRSQGKIDAMFVVSPNSVKDVWPEELLVHMPEWLKYEVLVDSPAMKRELRSMVDSNLPVLKIIVTNAEALASQDNEKLYAMFMARHRTLMVLDEFTRFKNPSAQRTKAALRLRKYTTYRRILSGTPITQGPLDIVIPFKWMDPDILGFTSWTQARAHHAIMGGWQQKQIIGYVKVEELYDKIAPHSFRVLTKDCFDLPEVVYDKRIVRLSPEAQRLYDTLRDDLVASVNAGEKITAAHTLVKVMRLSQIAGGFYCPDPVLDVGEGELDEEGWSTKVTASLERKAIPVPGGNAKLSALLEDLDELPPDAKAIIWARFVPEILMIEKALKEKYGDAAVVTFHGAVKPDDRTANRRRFQGIGAGEDNDPKCRFFVGQMETGGIGIRLSISDHMFYYSNSFSLESRLQSEKRMIDDQKIVKGVTDYVARGTVDNGLVGSLRKKKKFADLITGDSWQEWL